MNKEYVDRARKVIESLKDNRGQIQLTTSQICKFLAGVNAIKNKILIYEAEGQIKEGKIHADILGDVQALKVRLIYQCGREPSVVEPFVNKAGLIEEIDAIGNSVSKFRNFADYIEAIVAYHKFEGGRD